MQSPTARPRSPARIATSSASTETDTYLQDNHDRVGTFAFDQNTQNPNDSNFAYSNALLGNLYTYSQVTQLINYNPCTNVLDFYAQDTWKVNPHLVLDYGMRTSYSMSQRLTVGNNFVPSTSRAPALYQYNSSGSATDPTTGTSTYSKAYAGLFVPNTGNLNNGILYANTLAILPVLPTTWACSGSRDSASLIRSMIRLSFAVITASSPTQYFLQRSLWFGTGRRPFLRAECSLRR